MPQYLVADIETRVDKSLINRVNYPHDHLTDEDAYQRLRQKMLDQSNQRSDFIPWAYHVPISIAVGQVDKNYALTHVWTLGSAEQRMVCEFWRLVNEGVTLVTWNGRGFDMPVLEKEALRYGIPAKSYWGDQYGHRYRFNKDKHLDLQDIVGSNYGASQSPSLNLYAQAIGLPGKSGDLDGSQVQRMYEAGEHEAIARYCQRDVIITFLTFARVQVARGLLEPGRGTDIEHEALAMLGELDGPEEKEELF